MIAGTLEIQMLANMARLADDMHKAQDHVGSAMKNIERSVSQAKSVLAALGLGLSIGYFAHLVKGSIDAADKLGDLSKSTNLTVKELAGLNLLAKQSGTDLDGLAKAINKMSVEMGKDPEKFRALGITAKNNKEALMQFADVFAQLPDIQQRNAVAQAVFGKSWEQLAPVLSEGGQKIGEIIDKGALLSGNTQKMTEDADRFNDQMAEFNITLGATRNQLVGDMLPGMNRIAEAMREAAKEGNLFKLALVGIGGAIHELFGDSDLVKAQQQVDDLTRTLAHWREKQKNAKQYDDDHSIVRFFLGEDFRKEIARAETDLSAALQRLEAEKARLVPPPAAGALADAHVGAYQKQLAQDFLDEGKLRAAKIAADKQAEKESADARERETKRNLAYWADRKEKMLAAGKEIVAANEAAARESARYWEEFQENVQRNIGDVLYLGLQGKFKDIGELFKQLLLRMTADAAAAQLTKAMFGGAGMGAAMFGSAAVAAPAGFVGPMAPTAGLLGVGGAAAMTPAMIAGAAVVGGLLLAKHGFGMGNDWENVGGNRLVGQFTRAGFTGNRQQIQTLDGGWFGGDSSRTITSAIGSAESRALKKTVDDLQKTFNLLGDTIGYTAVRTRAWTVDMNLAGDITGALADGIGSQLVPSLEAFREAGENLAQTAQRITDAFIATNQFISGLGLSEAEAFGAIGIASGDARLALIDAAGGLQNFTSLAQQFSGAILTPAEQLQVSLDAVGRTFAQLGIQGVYTKDAFQQLIQDNIGDPETTIKLMAVADAFANIVNSAEQSTAALNKTAQDAYQTAFDAANALRAFGVSVRELMATLAGGSQAPGGANAGLLKAIFTSTNALAAGGDVGAQGKLAGSANAFLDAAKASAATALDYARDFAFIQNSLDATATATEGVVSAADLTLQAAVDANEFLQGIQDNTNTTANNITALASALAAQPAATPTVSPSEQISTAYTDAQTTLAGEDMANNITNKLAAYNAWLDLYNEAEAHPKFESVWTPDGWDTVDSPTYASLQDSAIAALSYYNSLPAFASGGMFGGGLRIVGENGPELEATGASRIISNQEIISRFGAGSGNEALVSEIKALRAELRAANVSIAVNTNRTAKVLERFDGNGMPEVREA